MKKKLIIMYFIAGCVWCIVTLPNLLTKSNNNVVKATLLAIARICLWPVFSVMSAVTKIKEIKSMKSVKNEST